MSEDPVRVRATDPDVGDIEGVLLLAPTGWPWWVVGYEHDGERATAVVHHSTVTWIEEDE